MISAGNKWKQNIASSQNIKWESRNISLIDFENKNVVFKSEGQTIIALVFQNGVLNFFETANTITLTDKNLIGNISVLWFLKP
ncbi:MAG: hypothetical protein RLZZ628_380 [Bacteroidota bacterium]|jgi:hypothetical protein